MKIFFNIYENAMYPTRKFRITKCWGYDTKIHHERKGVCFYIFKKILIIGISRKQKPISTGYKSFNTRIRYSKPTNETQSN